MRSILTGIKRWKLRYAQDGMLAALATGMKRWDFETMRWGD
jgi:hypothetical protein